MNVSETYVEKTTADAPSTTVIATHTIVEVACSSKRNQQTSEGSQGNDVLTYLN